ncbi:hypothetical protein [Endozoicomonas acroporae]|uniref:hypothetical protein n=1 Tax=Endozoicomonas acroporae TaxID=1701104 RepID=UPI0013CFEEFC|nr:hypothetical protein [Endozoicomonas acroporae]
MALILLDTCVILDILDKESQYRKQGGQKTGVLPDFYIGAQAAVCKWPLISRDKGQILALN